MRREGVSIFSLSRYLNTLNKVDLGIRLAWSFSTLKVLSITDYQSF
jgi:hypothetical protein